MPNCGLRLASNCFGHRNSGQSRRSRLRHIGGTVPVIGRRSHEYYYSINL